MIFFSVLTWWIINECEKLLGWWCSKSTQSSLILNQIFFIISVTVLKMDKQSDFHLSLFSRDLTGVWFFFMRVVYFKFFSFFARRNKNGKYNKNLKYIYPSNHQGGRTKYFTPNEKWLRNWKFNAGHLSLLNALDTSLFYECS